MGRFTDKLAETAQEWTGLTVQDAEYVGHLEEVSGEYDALADEAEELAIGILDYVGGRPQEIRADRRRALAQKSRVALARDPLAGAEANLRANFALGGGVPKPQAREEKVQEIIDEAWDDPHNARKLTSFEALRHRSNELLASANLYPVAFTKNGKTRIGFHDSDLVTDVVTDPEDEETPLWYVVRKRKVEWDFETDTVKPAEEIGYDGLAKTYYVEHWRNAEDAEKDAEEWGGEKPKRPPDEKILDGRMEHFRINRIGRTQFGTPPFARTLRFFSAMNQLTEAQVAMRQAASSIVAKRTRRGGPKDLMKTAGNIMSTAGELAASRFSSSSPKATGRNTRPDEGAAPPPAGSWWLENEADNLQAVNLSSGASQAAQDAQIVRAPISAASGFGQHYLGDPGSTNLATASTLELPTQMEVTSWQETLDSMLSWFTDLVLEEAVRAGRLGGMTSGGEKPMTELRLREGHEELEERTGLDLSYTLEMPYPGRRNLPDVTATVQSVATAFDPSGQNNALRRVLLDFFLRHGLQMEDPAALVDEIWPEDGPEYLKEQREIQKAQADQATGEAPPPPDADALRDPNQRQLRQNPTEVTDQSQYGERRKATPAAKAGNALQAELRELGIEQLDDGWVRVAREMGDDVEAAFADFLREPANFIGANGAAANGR